MGKGVVNKDGMTALWSGIVFGKAEWGSLNDPFPLGTDSPRISAFTLPSSVVRSFMPLIPIKAVLPEIEPFLAISYFISYWFSLMIRYFRPVLSLYCIKAKIHLAPQSSFSSLRLWCFTQNRLVSCTIQTLFHFWGHHSVIISLHVPTSFLFIPPLPEKTSEQRHGSAELTQ